MYQGFGLDDDGVTTYGTRVPRRLVERVTFHNPYTGFCVPCVKARGHRDLVTIIRHAAAIATDEWVKATGALVNGGSQSRQFRSSFLNVQSKTVL